MTRGNPILYPQLMVIFGCLFNHQIKKILLENILILELAWYIKKWLNVEMGSVFSYEDPSFEEKPIIQFSPIDNGYMFRSHYPGYEKEEIFVENIETKLHDFLSELNTVLKNEYNIVLNDHI